MSQSDNWNWNDDFKNYFYSDNIRSLINLHHINSYNDFIETKINKILQNPLDSHKGNTISGFYFNRTKSNNPLKVEMKFNEPRLETSSIVIQKDNDPNNNYNVPLTPNLCINRNLDYKGKLIVDVEINIEYDNSKKEDFKLKGVKLCELPLMIYSNQCYLYKQINEIINYQKKIDDTVENLDKLITEEKDSSEKKELEKKKNL